MYRLNCSTTNFHSIIQLSSQVVILAHQIIYSHFIHCSKSSDTHSNTHMHTHTHNKLHMTLWPPCRIDVSCKEIWTQTDTSSLFEALNRDRCERQSVLAVHLWSDHLKHKLIQSVYRVYRVCVGTPSSSFCSTCDLHTCSSFCHQFYYLSITTLLPVLTRSFHHV